MAKKSLEQRVSDIEGQLAGRTLAEHFREEAELIDQLFAYRFDQLDRKWGPRFSAIESDVSTLKSDVSVLKSDVSTLKSDVSVLKSDVSILKNDINALKNDMSVARKGISILLKRTES